MRTTPEPVPCGKCYACLANNRAQWIFRLLAEYHAHPLSLFVTLTYDNEHLPFRVSQVIEDTGEEIINFISDDNRFGSLSCFSPISAVPSVNKRDIQLFIKRLRKSLREEKCRYFCTAEYGGKTQRPHYHIIFFFGSTDRRRYYDAIQECWPYGNVKFGDAEPASVAYTTKYCLKETKPPQGAEKGFRLMSTKPALGDIGYKQYLQYVDEDNFFHTSFKNMRAATPRLWRDKYLNSLDEEKKEDLKILHMSEIGQERLEKYRRWSLVNKGKSFSDYCDYLERARERKEALIKKHLSQQSL